MSTQIINSLKGRRSYYGISKETTVSDDVVKKIVEEGLKYTPSAFNSQSSRAVLLLKEQHDKLWDIVMEALRKIVPTDQFKDTEDKINSFKNGYGSVLFFEDADVIHSLQTSFPLYQDNFPVWSEQSTGMVQLVVWSSLEEEGLGASLQHYNELIEETVKAEWNLPSNWKLKAQMPFGKPTATPDEKEFRMAEDDFRVIQ